MLPHGFLNGGIVFLLKHRFAKNNTPIFHMETLPLFSTNKIITVQPRWLRGGVPLTKFEVFEKTPL